MIVKHRAFFVPHKSGDKKANKLFKKLSPNFKTKSKSGPSDYTFNFRLYSTPNYKPNRYWKSDEQ